MNIYKHFGKRLIDILASACGLLLLAPLFAVVALSIKLDSRGPVFFRQGRVGKDGHAFRIVKFRSMDAVSSTLPAGITVSGDKRVTSVGRVLRRYKIDELPQLWNVLSGEMSLVGPRPELAKYVDSYSPEQRIVLTVRPGITDPATLAYRHEEEILSQDGDPETLYRTRILPDKLNRNISYIRQSSFRTDLLLIFHTVFDSFLPASRGSSPPSSSSGNSHTALPSSQADRST